MNLRTFFHVLAVCCMLMFHGREVPGQSQIGSTFSFQGQLRSSENPMTGSCDFKFTLFDAATGGNQVGPVCVKNQVAVKSGLFNVELDFGNNAFGGMRWLEVAVAFPSGSGAYSVLAPRHKLIPAPLALVAAAVAPGAVTNASLASESVTSDKIRGVDWSKITGAPVAMVPAGPAGGVLAGQYPNPLLAASAVTNLALADGAVTDRKIASVAWDKIIGIPSWLASSGAAGGVLAGFYPNPTLASRAVTGAALADGAVTSRTLADGAVTSRTLADGAVTSRTLADGAVTSEKIHGLAWNKIVGAPTALAPAGAAGGVLGGEYPNPTLAGQAVTSAALANGAVIARTLADGAVTSRTLADGAVTDDKIRTVGWNKILGFPGGLPPTGAATGDLTGSYPAPVIAPGAVSASKLADGSVTSAKLADGSVTSAKLPDGSVTSAKLAEASVGTAALTRGAVTSASLADQAVTASKLAVPLAMAASTTTETEALFTLVNNGPGFAFDTMTSGHRPALRAQSYGFNGAALQGIARAGERGTGVVGESVHGFGVTGRNTNSSNFGHIGTPREGVYGESWNGYGVSGFSHTSGAGVYGEARRPAVAGLFIGDVEVSGSLTACVNEFWIDHPQDPNGFWLTHANISSNERSNLYSGNVVTDAEGSAEVVMPPYFGALNMDFRYQLTVIGQFAQAIVGSEIQNNRFTIRTDRPGVKVSWQVIGVRHDLYARDHPLAVEVSKEPWQ